MNQSKLKTTGTFCVSAFIAASIYAASCTLGQQGPAGRAPGGGGGPVAVSPAPSPVANNLPTQTNSPGSPTTPAGRPASANGFQPAVVAPTDNQTIQPANTNINLGQSDNNSPVPSRSSDQQNTAPSVANTNAAKAANAVSNAPDLVEANNAVRIAQSDFEKERQRVILGLQSKPEYQKALSTQHETDPNIDANKAPANADPSPALIEAATAKMNASTGVTQMEEQAITVDEQASAAKTKLTDAVSKRDQIAAKLKSQH